MDTVAFLIRLFSCTREISFALLNWQGTNRLSIFSGRTDAEAETPILRPPDAKSWLTGKDPDAGKDWRQEEKGMTADEMVGWHHRLNGHEFEQAPGDSEGQGSLVCCSPWVAKNRTQLSDWTATKPSLLYRISIRHRLLLYGWCHFIWKGITTLLDMEKVSLKGKYFICEVCSSFTKISTLLSVHPCSYPPHNRKHLMYFGH